MTAPKPVALPAHSPDCHGCGPRNAAGLRMQVWRSGDEVYSDVVFQPHHVGAPGLAHGGAVSAACDDLFGFVLYVVGQPGVTRSLEIDYLAPVELGVPHRVTAGLDRREGRKLYMAASGVRPDGQVSFTARSVFLVVDLAHFERFGVLANHPGLDWLGRGAG
ncbi:MAG TPA: PaaI family thioesterase [Pseudonocardia sp.]|jgi:acyl-coenzyme A thioesterase PaaI-like protein|uniref:PaaI family thioesterase n=1 Tax=Pseudonocardia sp. TaxID=60912 RepID=UPI002BA99700|nr:PaaI family thioesterase [Pseudonocardia sp.]HTF50549.1 PaaI family thioesterase [Pseudonocardia sp.]